MTEADAVQITVNGRAVAARKGEYVIAAAERAGTYIPRFCYHERMRSVGMCRMCLVEIDAGRGPQLQPSCMVTVAPDMTVETESPAAKQAQEGIIELLLANHPLDCPVCDKGGECPLQDQAFSHGPGESRYVEEKRHFEKPIPISDLVLLDRERCILCDRCTRFADEVAGDALIHFTERGNETQVMTFPDEPFASYFSGNTVQICPVGALTATPYRFKSRPWDLAESEGTCTGCSVGCRISVQSSRDELVRYLGVDSDAVNWGWLCDKGRFGFEATNSNVRLTTPLVRQGDADRAETTSDGTTLPETTLPETTLMQTSWGAAMAKTADILRDTPADRIAVLGGARGTNEDAFAWAQLADALGIAKRDAQLGDDLPAAVLDLPRATITEATTAPTIVVLNSDPKEELGVLYLRLRHAAEQRTSRLIELTPTDTGLTPNAWRSARIEPGGASAAVAALGAEDVAAQLAAGPVVIVAGRSNLAESGASAGATLRSVFEAVAKVQPDVKVLPALRRGNVVGALQLGIRPAAGGPDAAGILAQAAAGDIDVLVLLGADPIADHPDAELSGRALAEVGTIIALDTFVTDSSSRADIVLPVSGAGEQDGTTTNLEGRVSVVSHRVTPAGTARADWMIAAELADRLGHDDLAVTLRSTVAITAAIAASVPAYAAATPDAVGHREGVLAVPSPADGTGSDGGASSVGPDSVGLAGLDVPKRNSYDYRIVLSRSMYDLATMTQHAPSLAPLVGTTAAHLNPADVDKVGVADGDRVRLVGVRASATLPVVADAAVPRGIVRVPFNQPAPNGTAGGNGVDGTSSSSGVTALIDATAAITDVRIEGIP